MDVKPVNPMEEILREVNNTIENEKVHNPFTYAEAMGKAKVVAKYGTNEEQVKALDHIATLTLLMLTFAIH